jgi:acyl-CoA synthetase (NDP forming)
MVAESLGLESPLCHAVNGPGEVPDLDGFPGDRLVVKLLSPLVAHRTEVGGVMVVPKVSHEVVRAVEELAARTPDPDAAYLLQEFVPHDREPGAEVLVGARWTQEFGPVVTLALGGVAAEAMASLGRPGGMVLLWSPRTATRARVQADLAGPLGALLTGDLRGRPPRVPREALVTLVMELLAAVPAWIPVPILEMEFNPVVFRNGNAVALDALVRLSPADLPVPPAPPEGARPGLRALLHPRSLAIVGASAKGLNPGRIILRNNLAAGMEPAAVQVVKEGIPELDGCRCVPTVAALDPVDTLVLSVAASEVPALLEQVTDGGKAKGVVLTSGGLEEGGDGEAAARIRTLLARPGAPVLNGANCLGIRSVPGRSDTLFIPPRKLGFPFVPPHPVALVSQSGAFAIARTSTLPWLNPRFVVTVGNQTDVTVGEWLQHLVEEPELDVVGCYVEGFRPGDGARFLSAAEAHRRKGRIVILYRAGRTPAGQDATRSHTASLSGDYGVTRALAESSGVLVADTVQDFGDLLGMAVRLHGRSVAGPGLGLVSNAGFECVAMADHLGGEDAGLGPAALSPGTLDALHRLLSRARLAEVVSPRNPLDLTPILDDEGFAGAVGILLADRAVDAAVVGCVPLTPALRTLPEEDDGEGSVATLLAALWRTTEKAWVVSVDGGPSYDALARELVSAGIPVLRHADRAAALLGRYMRVRLGDTE